MTAGTFFNAAARKTMRVERAAAGTPRRAREPMPVRVDVERRRVVAANGYDTRPKTSVSFGEKASNSVVWANGAGPIDDAPPRNPAVRQQWEPDSSRPTRRPGAPTNVPGGVEPPTCAVFACRGRNSGPKTP